MGSRVPFRELVSDAVGGGWGQETPFAESIPTAVIRGTDFENVRYDEFARVPRRHEASRKASRRQLRPNDILLEVSGGSPTSGQSTGRSLLVTERMIEALGGSVIPASFCRRIRIDENRADPQYAYYALQDMYASGRAGDYEHRSTGISNFQFEFFLDQELIPLPPLPEQRRIAGILCALDDKIELNRRMNQTLESMARALFKSWFVDFDPVRAKAEGRDPNLPSGLANVFPNSFEDSESGEIPCGWRPMTLGDVCERPQYGFTASAIDQPLGPRFLRITDINKLPWIEWSTVPFCEATQKERQQYGVKPGDILIARMADPGHGVMVEEDADAVFASYLIRFRPQNQRYARFLQYWLRSEDYWSSVEGYRTGTTRASLNAQVLSSFRLVLPPPAVAEAFGAHVSALRSALTHSVSESAILAETRDALLPRLLSAAPDTGAASGFMGGGR